MPAKSKSEAQTQADLPADLIDRQLERYRSMRDFKITAEPSGDSSGRKPGRSSKVKPPVENKRRGLPFVIQKHAATRLHYDFRLGWKGVLKSWAVAKGPSYVTADKRLAVQVEDHPMEYGGFEGVIPKGQYGGGTVMLWDEGTWEPQAAYPDVDEGLRTGSLKFTLHGSKMKGNWALIRMGGKAAKESKPNWLLIKEHDDFERTNADPAITDEAPDSVVTGRSLEEIASSGDHVWNSKDTASGNAWHRSDKKAAEAPEGLKVGAESGVVKVAHFAKTLAPAKLKNFGKTMKHAPVEKMPEFLAPQLALQGTAPPAGVGWLHELKLDGYRIQARKEGSKAQLFTRTGLDWTDRMKSIAAAVALLPARSFIADGEVVVLAEDGTTSFADLQASFQERVTNPLTYFLFDLLHLNGRDLRGLELVRRKELLAELLASSGETIRLSEHIEGNGAAVFRGAGELGAEGIVSKRATSTYASGRSASWVKMKCIRGQELVIVGFTPLSNGSYGIGALLLGYYRDKTLVYAGRTGTGFTQKIHKSLRDRLEKLRVKSAPFAKLPEDARRGVTWVNPELVAQVNFANWTADGLARQASFQGLREDKPASEVVREGSGAIAKEQTATHASFAPTAPVATKAVPGKARSGRSVASVSEHAPVKLTHPDKVLDPESRLTKQLLADYYWQIAPFMLPHIAGRPLSLVRCPEGVAKPCFFQKHANKTLPHGIEAVDVRDKKTGKIEPYITLSTPTALAELAQMGVLEVHPWGSRNDDLERPDRITIDLDPDVGISWPTLAASAVEVRTELKQIGLESFVKTTGGKGLHIVVPIKSEYEWPVVKEFTHAFVLGMEKRAPKRYLTKMSKAARVGRIFLDYLRNERGATAVAAYSPRSRPGATVSLPIPWTDLKLGELPVFHVTDYREWQRRLERDPWKGIADTEQGLSAEMLKELRIEV